MRRHVGFGAAIALFGLFAIPDSSGDIANGSGGEGVKIDGLGALFGVKKDLGVLRQGATVSHVLNIENLTTESLKVAGLTSSCGCTVPDIAVGDVVAPSGVLEVSVRVNLANKRPGGFKESVVITFEASLGVVTLELTGSVSVEYPDNVNLGLFLAGSTASKKISIPPGAGQPPLALTGVDCEIDGVQAEAESSGTLPGGLDVSISAFGKRPGEKMSGWLKIHTNDSEVPVKLIKVHGEVRSVLEVSESKLVFGRLEEFETAEKTVVVRSPYVSGSPEFDIVQRNPKHFTLTAIPDESSEVTVLKVVVNPAGVSDGLLKDIVYLTTNDGTKQELTLYALVKRKL